MTRPKHNPMPGPDIPPDTLAQAAAYDYEEAEATDAELAAEAAAKAAAEAGGEAVEAMRSTGAILEETAATAAQAKDSAAHTAVDLSASTRGAATEAGQQLSSAAGEAAARASAATEAAGEKAHEAQAGAAEGGGGWSWDGVADWSQRQWDSWRPHPQQWAEYAGHAADDWRQWASWDTRWGWQERHWEAFEERQRRRLAALTEEQRQAWAAWEERQRARLGELTEEGEQLLKRELGAFEEWQRRYCEAHHPEEAAHKRPASQQFRLSYLMLPLLPNFRESLGQFGKRTKMGLVGEMREAGTKIADTLQAAGGIFKRN